MKRTSGCFFLWIMFTVLFFAVEGVCEEDSNELTVAYVGLDKTHVRYKYVGSPTTLSITLKRDDTVLDSSSGTLEGTICDKDLDPGAYTYSIVHRYYYIKDGKKIEVEGVVFSRSGTVNGETIRGTLLFDEEVDAASKKISTYIRLNDGWSRYTLTVPADKSLSIRNAQLENVEVEKTVLKIIPSAIIDAGASSVRDTSLTVDETLDANHGTVGNRAGGNISFYNCKFSGIKIHTANESTEGEALYLKNSSPSVYDSVFFKYVRIDGKNESVFTGNLFKESIIFDYPGSSEHQYDPTIQDNSFLGKWALIGPDSLSRPINIGNNYYGDKNGPGRQFDNSFLGPRGAIVDAIFSLSGYADSGSHLPESVPPTFWMSKYIMGQSAVSHEWSRLSPAGWGGKETLLSIEIVSSHQEVADAKVIVEIDGETLPDSIATGPAPVLYRDISQHSDTFLANGYATFDFILPAMDKTCIHLKAWLDTTGVKGFDSMQKGKELIIDEPYIFFNQKKTRPLYLFVQPVNVVGQGGPSTPVSKIVSDIRNLISAMLPFDRANLHVWGTSKAVSYTPGAGISQGLSLYPLAMLNSAVRGLFSLCDWASGAQVTPDFVISVFPGNSFPAGVEGMNVKLFRSTLFVTEDKLKALVHELGHAGPGLYLDKEQYDDPRWAPSGMRLKGMSLFVTDKAGDDFSISRYRFLHFPENTNQMWYDIMGAVEPSWIAVDTLASFAGWNASRSRAYPASDQRLKTVGDYPVPAGEWRIFFNAHVEADSVFPARQRLIPGTVTAFNVSLFADYNIVIPNSPSYAYWKAYDASGNLIKDAGFYIPDDDGQGFLDYDALQLTADVPDSTTLLELYNLVYAADGSISGSELVLSLPISDTLSTRIISPSNGETLEEGVVLQWQTTQTRSMVSPDRTSGQSLQHQVHVSHDGGQSWNPMGWFIEDERLEIPLKSLAAGDNISFRVITSDGLRYAEDRVDNLRIPARPPVVTVRLPLEGDRSDPGHAWSFSGESYSLDEDLDAEGKWTSSLDGELGTGASLQNIVLTEGDHVITYTVVDSKGLSGHAGVGITVEQEAIESFDFAFASDALKITIPGKDPYEQRLAPLVLNKAHPTRLSLRNTGTHSTLSLKLFMKAPGQTETLLKETAFALGPFDEVLLTTEFTPVSEGDYVFRAVVESTSPADSNPANNQRLWTHSTSTIGAVTVSRTGSGAISSDPIGISCGENCSGSFERGGYVILTATPEPGWAFKEWEGDCSGSDKTCAVLLDRQASARAVFQFAPSSMLYVSPTGDCGGKPGCHASIQSAMDAAESGALILIENGTYPETITLKDAKLLTLQGGWNSSFTQPSGTTTIKAPSAPQGSLTIQNVNIEP